MATARLLHIDAFAERPFEGNPAMVCLLPDRARPTEAWMAEMGAEINLSETAFVRPLPDDPDNDFEIRWFTPVAEVDLCGHATLASAHALFSTGGAEGRICFKSRSGTLTVTEGDDGLWMDFPAKSLSPTNVPDLASALGTEAIESLAQTSGDDLFVTLGDATAVRALAPDFGAIAALPEHRGVIVTARGDRDETDFVSRFFAPKHNINEDPVTGSAHCALAPFWGERLGKTELVGHQVSARGGRVLCRVEEGDRVHLGGRGVTIYTGEIELPAP